MSPLDSVLFDGHPEALLLVEEDAQRVRAANNAAQALFGYDAEAFAGLRLTAIGLSEAALTQYQIDAGVASAASDLGVHSLSDAEGEGLLARLWVRKLEQGGETLHLLWLERTAEGLAARAGAERLSWRAPHGDTGVDLKSQHFEALFESTPAALLGLEPEHFTVVAASDAFLEATGLARDAVLGRSLLELFPGDKVHGAAAGQRALRESLEYVSEHGLVDAMGIRRVVVRVPSSQESAGVARYWTVVNAPVRDKQGRAALIIQRIEDVTDFVDEGALDPEWYSADRRPVSGSAPSLLLHARDLQRSHDELRHQAAVLRNAQRLVHMATWSVDPATGRFEVSEQFMHMLGAPDEAPLVRFDAFLARVHPDDRKKRRALQEELMSGDRSLSCEYRLQLADGSSRDIQEAAESLSTDEGRFVYGALRDVTEEKRARKRFNELRRLMHLVGKSSHFGGWRFDVAERRLQWGLETAAIHGLPDGTPEPDVEAAIDFYVPEHRPRIREAFELCLRDGTPFDEVLQMRTASGELIWVRAIGAPEWDDARQVAAIHGSIQNVTALITAEARYDAMARHLRETLEHVNEGFTTMDRDWRVTFANRSAAELVGADPERVIGQSLWEVVPELSGTEFAKRLKAAMRRAEPDTLIDYYPPLDKWVELRMHPTEEGLAVHSQDVTEERIRHERLRLLETAVSRLNDVVLITEAEPIEAPEGPKIVFANDALERRTGYAVEEVIGKTPRFLQGAETQRAALDRLRQAMERWQSTRVELINYKRDGTPFWLELDLAPIADDSGWFTHWVAVERDITDRKRAEEAARINAERFDLVARAANDVIWDWDIENDTVWRNEGSEALFGCSPDALEPGAESWKARIHPDDRERVLASIEAVIHGEDNRWLDEYRFLRADGVAVTVIDHGFVMRDASGRATRMVGALNDVSERRELDERLRQSQKLETLGQLTGGVAHDFNNLLTVILGNSEMLSHRLAEDKQLQELANMTASAAERGAELTNRLLSFARRQPLEPREVDCNSLLRDMDLLFRRTLPEDIKLELIFDERLWCAEVDPSQLENALLNLVLNARDAMPAGGRLMIETANIRLDNSYPNQYDELLPGNYVMLSVSDSGKGMDRQQCAQAFEPFFTTKEVGQGSGLGLSMVYGFVKQTGGLVKIYSEPGEGTTVRLYLPRAESGQNESSEAEGETPMIGGSEHILVVEDDPLVRAHLSTQLESLGYRVSLAASGPEALKLLAELEDVDLLFTDVVMPGGMNGRELAEEVVRLRPGMRTLFTSGYAESAIVHQGRLDPGVQLLSKPYRRQDLADKLRKALDRD